MRGGIRKGAGRPRGEPTRALPVRVTEDRIAAYQEAAARSGSGLREWVESALDREAAMGWCDVCRVKREHRTCVDCGREADVIDCGHGAQPVEIAASARFPHDPVCAECATRREEVMTDLPLTHFYEPVHASPEQVARVDGELNAANLAVAIVMSVLWLLLVPSTAP